VYLTICVEWTEDDFRLASTWIDPRLMKIWKICAKNDFYIFFRNNLNLYPFDFKFAVPFTWIQGHVSTKFKVLMASWFRVNRRHGTDRRTDRRTGCNAASYGGQHNEVRSTLPTFAWPNVGLQSLRHPQVLFVVNNINRTQYFWPHVSCANFMRDNEAAMTIE